MSRRLLIIVTLGAFLGIFASQLSPVQGKLIKLAFLASLGIFWLGSVLLLWNVKIARWALVLIFAVVALMFMLPGRPVVVDELRDDYVERMGRFESTQYYWGGESRRGIDCSGLPRRALRDALFSYGFQHVDGRAMRAYFKQWWFDASARALSEGYREYAQPLEISGTIRTIDDSMLAPGDMAITSDGVHVVVYAGEGEWIQASPDAGQVITLDGRSGDSVWFEVPVEMYRWSVLSQS